jgi:hypothetical protein
MIKPIETRRGPDLMRVVGALVILSLIAYSGSPKLRHIVATTTGIVGCTDTAPDCCYSPDERNLLDKFNSVDPQGDYFSERDKDCNWRRAELDRLVPEYAFDRPTGQ